MTSPLSPPNRRRRRIVVTLAVFLMSLATWWYWPRIDSRFVGQWTITGDGVRGDVAPFEFKPDGHVEGFMYRPSQMEIRQHSIYCWSVVGGRLVLAPPSPSIQQFDQLPGYWIGRLFGGEERRYEIQEIGPSTMCLRDTTNGIESRYVR